MTSSKQHKYLTSTSTGVDESISSKRTPYVNVNTKLFEVLISEYDKYDVAAYPQGEPEIAGALDMYSAGDVVSVNCSAPPSYPPPSILFYNNGIRVC